MTNTTNDKKRGQIVPYADPRAYTDRLNALFTPQGWTREYRVETMTNITRVKKGESVISGKVLVTCTVTISGIGSHSGTGEEWADDDNGMTSADAQAFKRACSCFGLGRYFYDIAPIWVDLDQNRQPVRTPVLSAWALPENWRKGMRPSTGNGDGGPNNRPEAAVRTGQTARVAQKRSARWQMLTTGTVTNLPRKPMDRLQLTPATTSTIKFWRWRKLSATPCTVTSCGNTVESTSQS